MLLTCSVDVMKRLKKRSTSTRKSTAAEEGELLSSSLSSISSSHAISPVEEDEEEVQVLLRAMNVVDFWIEHHYKVCDCKSNGWVWWVGVVSMVGGVMTWLWSHIISAHSLHSQHLPALTRIPLAPYICQMCTYSMPCVHASVLICSACQ